jgi:uncharacterized protein (DUF169 family)
MIDLKKIEEELNMFVRPTSFPLAIKACKSLEDIPERAKRPKKDMGVRIPLCQGIGMSRKYGWTVAMAKEDVYCSALIAMGFHKTSDFSPPDFYEKGKLCAGAFYTATEEAGAKTEEMTMKFAHNEYQCFIVSPLSRATFEPDVIVVYGDPAQTMRMGLGALHMKGGVLSATFSGRLGCTQLIVRPIKTGECQFILPGMGERMYAATQDHEMAFAIPKVKLDEFMDGLRGTHKGGLRYPIPTFLRYPPIYIPVYHEYFDSVESEESPA